MRIVLISKLLLFSILLDGQSESDIFNAIHLNDDENIRNKSVEKIIEENWDVWVNDEIHYRWIEYKLNEDNRMLESLTKIYDQQDSIDVEIHFRYIIDKETALRDSSYFAIRQFKTAWETTQTTTYHYDLKGFIREIKTYSIDGGIISHKIFEVNDKGHPIKIESKRPSIKQEIAEYDYENNKLIITKLGKTEAFTRVDTMILFPRIGHKYPTENMRYNLRQDIVYEKRDRSFIHHDYKYDEFGNWIVRETFFIDLNRREVKLSEVVKRTFFYK